MKKRRKEKEEKKWRSGKGARGILQSCNRNRVHA